MVVAATTPKLTKTSTRHPSPSPIVSSSENRPSKTRSNSTLRNSTSTSTSSSTRFSSPLPARSLSATRTRPANTAASTTTSSTTTRSLSVSFQGQSFVYQTTKCRDSTPPPARKPSPKRQQSIQTPNVAPGSAPARPAAHLPWPSAKMHLSNPIPLTKSLDCSLTKRGPALASAIKSLRRSMMFSDEALRRNSLDSSEFLFSSDTDSSSSGSLETSIAPRARLPPPRGGTIPELSINTRVKRVAEPNNTVRKSTMAASPLNGSSRLISCSPVRRMPSPSRTRNGLSNAKMVPTNVEGRRRKKTESRMNEEHLLRVLYSSHLQWCCINAQADAVHAVQKTTAERCLYDAWIAISEKLDSVMLRRLEVHLLKYKLKLITIFKGQMRYLEELSVVDGDYFNSLSGLIDALKATTLCLPVTDGAKADTLEVKNAIGSAVDVMQSVSRSACTLLSKVQETKFLMSELADVVVRERDLMQQCRELLSTIAALQVKYCSMEGQRLQLTHQKENEM